MFGISATDVLNALVPPFGYRREPGLRYGAGDRHLLDIYSPARKKARAPVVVFFYGGGWETGDRESYLFAGAALAARGFVTAIPDYRLYPAVRFPGFIEDAAAAVGWVRDNADRFGGDPDRMVLMGHSAGAYIAAMLGLDGRWLRPFDISPRRLRGLVGLSGPYDFLPLHSATLKSIFGAGEGLADTQPINFVGNGVPSAFLATSRRDRYVDPGNTRRLAERIGQHGGRVTVKVYDRLSHEAMVGVLAAPLHFLAPVLRDVAGFVEAVTADAPTRVGVAEEQAG